MLIQSFYDMDWAPFDSGTLACPSTFFRLQIQTLGLAPRYLAILLRSYRLSLLFEFGHVDTLSSYSSHCTVSGIMALVFGLVGKFFSLLF